MPKAAQGLTQGHLKKAEPGLYADGGGLYLQITARGAKSWIFRFQIDGKRRDMGLGSVADVGLAAARDRAAEARKLVREGVDPIAAREARRAEQRLEDAKAKTFRDVAATYIASMTPSWRSAKHAAQWSATLESYAHPVIGDLPINGIDTGLVVQVLEPIWLTKTETASRVRQRIEAILAYAKVRGWRTGDNPASWKGHLDQVFPAKAKVARISHHASMAYAEMPRFWPRLELQDGMGARALQLAILTATRSGEVLLSTWQEFDLDNRCWSIPAVRMKAGTEHRVPLSKPAIGLLHKLATVRTSDDAYVFPGQRKNRPLSNMSMAMTLRRIGVDATPHGFRSTFRTWAAECTGFPHDVCEAALAHTPGNKVVEAYQRGDFFRKRTELMDEWASHVTTSPVRQGARTDRNWTTET